MYNARSILSGLGVFLVLITFPFWYNVGKSAAAPEPKLDTPAIQQLSRKQCVGSTPYMRANHMQLLEEWRTLAVREGKRVYEAADGKKYEISLEKTCLKCHGNKAQFCDQCHNSLSVKPDCWNCHVAPEGR
ncbi:MAG: sulfate reduction electron transfer complex DsrMKJOP subunit DsrJ [Firmicutes bacterium]|nr:sulfate reduction electron transfer complex DsrMKJOP subunit DsrJ [Bacillota bacterium]MCL5040389.1 sulfate reduction electron transfer complex DsrMKJOP subunit DsrJ [Bacillota bacterium]